MMPQEQQYGQDLVVVVPDKDMESAMRGILNRNTSLGIRTINFRIFTHFHRDPGCLLEGHLLIRPYSQIYSNAIIMFDREGCGQDGLSRGELEARVEQNLASSGWNSRAVALVLDPELEIWIWKDSPHVDEALGWAGRTPNLRTWLLEKKFITSIDRVPARPKEAMEEALRAVRKPRSSSIYLKLAETVGFRNCINPTFVKLRTSLQQWFGEGNYE